MFDILLQQEQMCNEPPHGFLSQSSARMSLPSALRLGRDHDTQDHTSKLQFGKNLSHCGEGGKSGSEDWHKVKTQFAADLRRHS